MPIGVDDVSAVASLVALSVACLHGCLKGFLLLRRARTHGRDVSAVILMIELEEHRLYSWAGESGLLDSPPRLSISTKHVEFVPPILAQIRDLLQDLKKLKTKYGLNLQSTNEDIEEVDEKTLSFGIQSIGGLSQNQGRTAGLLQKAASPWKKLQWMTVDEQNVRTLMEKADEWVKQLEGFLEDARLMRMEQKIDTFLRTAILNTINYQELEVIGHTHGRGTIYSAPAAAARLKYEGLHLGIMSQHHDSQASAQTSASDLRHLTPLRRPSLVSKPSDTRLSSMRLSMSQLAINSPRPNSFRTFERYHRKPVLIEWKEVGYLNFKALETRVDCVSTFLQKLETSFHSLPCRGYVKDHDARRYGYVFDLPIALDTSMSPSMSEPDVSDVAPFPTVYTLREILDLEAPAPSLNLRVSYAVRLLETLLQLHTSGWLHKKLRSENLLFIQNASSSSYENDLAVDDLGPSQMYLAGYVYTRADDPAEMTEPLQSELEADLYRHPSTIGRDRLPFRKTFDMFSVGCILLELGLWATFSTTLRRQSDRPRGNRRARRNDTDKQAKNTITAAQKPMSPTRGADKDPSASISRSIDLLKVRSELLSSLSPRFHPKILQNGDTETSATTPMHKVFKALESATGKTFADVVRDLISAETLREGKSELGLPVNEHQDALALEMQSLNKLRSILEVI